jgi:squalene-hopene/tetraprenyl-beta-curcumene cyclase
LNQPPDSSQVKTARAEAGRIANPSYAFGVDFIRVENAHAKLRQQLLQFRNEDGFWAGKLSDSALSTATAISALAIYLRNQNPENREAIQQKIEAGLQYLTSVQNEDGGFGDTDRSYSNIATTFLVIAAWKICEPSIDARRAWEYIEKQGSWSGLRARYGRDKTFVVPILSNCALAGLVPWKEVDALPFEAAALPQAWYRLAQMPVVSYAIPALVAIGQARFHHAPPANPLVRLLRQLSLAKTRKVLRAMQPESGGYLEATPLTSFVLMNLAGSGQANSDVAFHGVRFLLESAQPNGSWPIDTNLATWLTSLAIHSLNGNLVESEPESKVSLEPTTDSEFEPTALAAGSPNRRASFDLTIEWLLSCQHCQRHPFTGAEPGGWGWTNLSGAVPDADDTPAALLALHAWCRRHRTLLVSDRSLTNRIASAVELGIGWLLKLQNRDGGWPTFCRGWGKLPFDRSGADLTAHAIRALSGWQATAKSADASTGKLELNLANQRIEQAILRGLTFLRKTQRSDGSWLPLWFGNQDRPDDENPVYGTARVLMALADLLKTPLELEKQSRIDRASVQQLRDSAVAYLLTEQNHDGGWGSPKASSIEETSVALEAILTLNPQIQNNAQEKFSSSITAGLVWLVEAIEADQQAVSQPIGFYFAKLWYYEQLYPYVFPLAALRQALGVAKQ